MKPPVGRVIGAIYQTYIQILGLDWGPCESYSLGALEVTYSDVRPGIWVAHLMSLADDWAPTINGKQREFTSCRDIVA
jgi:hypothetical protein